MTTMNMNLKKLAKKRAQKDEGKYPEMPEPKDRSEKEPEVVDMYQTDSEAGRAGRGADYAYNSESEKDRRSAVSRAGRGASGPGWEDVEDGVQVRYLDSDEAPAPEQKRRNGSSDKMKRAKKFAMVRSMLSKFDSMDKNGNGIPDKDE